MMANELQTMCTICGGVFLVLATLGLVFFGFIWVCDLFSAAQARFVKACHGMENIYWSMVLFLEKKRIGISREQFPHEMQRRAKSLLGTNLVFMDDDEKREWHHWRIETGRDAVHTWLMDDEPKE